MSEYKCALKVRNLEKVYPSFHLDDVSFKVKKGEIMGFVGRNGAGKTTTLKCLLNMVKPSRGEVFMFDEPYLDNELDNKQRLSFVLGGVNYYAKTKIKRLTDVTKRFYKDWDENKYRSLIVKFGLSEDKKVGELSEGMKVKYALSIALSHHAELLILDEPTSGLDPVSRNELLEIFMDLVDHEQVSILFSTHITSDLDKCADSITYIHQGKIVASESLKSFEEKYWVLNTSDIEAFKTIENDCVSFFERRGKIEALIERSKYSDIKGIKASIPDLDTIMVYFERRAQQ